MNIYVGNLSYKVRENDLQGVIEEYGAVESCKIIKDRETGKSKGFAFVEIIQPCIIFHDDKGYKEKTYSLEKEKHDKTNFDKAWEKAGEFDYNGVNEKTKIPLGIFYQKERETFEEINPQLAELKKNKKSWKDISR